MSAGENSVTVWDPVVRIFHWTVVAGMPCQSLHP